MEFPEGLISGLGISKKAGFNTILCLEIPRQNRKHRTPPPHHHPPLGGVFSKKHILTYPPCHMIFIWNNPISTGQGKNICQQKSKNQRKSVHSLSSTYFYFYFIISLKITNNTSSLNKIFHQFINL